MLPAPQTGSAVAARAAPGRTWRACCRLQVVICPPCEVTDGHDTCGGRGGGIHGMSAPLPTRPALAALADPAVLPDPYPVLAGLREASPFTEAGGALVVVGRHEDCSRILRDPRGRRRG